MQAGRGYNYLSGLTSAATFVPLNADLPNFTVFYRLPDLSHLPFLTINDEFFAGDGLGGFREMERQARCGG